MVMWVSFCCGSPLAWGGADEGFAAYQRGDYLSAYRIWLPLAQRGDARAQGALGALYADGRGVPQDDGEAVKWFRLAAAQRLAGAQYALGMLYRKGQGVPQDDGEAVTWFRLAATQGYPKAQFMLGVLYRQGEGVPQDYAEAVKWLRTAADQGESGAQGMLGIMYEYGQGVPRDEAQAATWYRKAAEQGDSVAQLGLGALYADGRGVPQDLIQAQSRRCTVVSRGLSGKSFEGQGSRGGADDPRTNRRSPATGAGVAAETPLTVHAKQS
jgi:TPR repeat protein